MELNVVLDRHAAVAMNLADQICGLNPRYSWEIEKEKQEQEDRDKDGADGAGGGDPTVHLGGPDQEKETGEDGALVEPVDQPYMVLPYSRASLRKPKDHFPKLHAIVSLKNPDEEQLVISTTNPFVNRKHGGDKLVQVDVPKSTSTGPFSKKSKHTQECVRNHF